MRIIGTVRAQVEGRLVMDLGGELPINEVFQSARSLQESISTAATNRGTDNPQLWSMLAAGKTISYNAAKHEIYFHFFTMEAACRYDRLDIPFHKGLHALKNAHAPAELSPGPTVWDIQYEVDGALVS